MSSQDKVKVRNIPDQRRIWRGVLLGLIYLFVLLINGLDEFIRSGFSVEFMFTAEWWAKVFRVITSNILVFLGTFLFVLDSMINKREDIKKKRKELDTTIDEHLDPVTFDPFFVDFERNRKIEYYKRDLEAQIEKLERKASLEDMRSWTRKMRNGTEDPEVNQAFENSEFCQRKKMILEQLEPEFIEEHIDYMHIKYKPLSKSFVTSGYNKPHKRYDDYAIETSWEKMFWDLLPKFIMLAGFLIAGESIIVQFEPDKPLALIMYNMLIKIIPLILQIYFANGYTNIYIDEKIMVDLRRRLDIVIKYLSFKKGVGKNG